MQYCTKCLNVEWRPRITFNNSGVCSACQWAEKKKVLDWETRWKKLEQLCDKFRRDDDWDVIVPCSGGKDGSYVAWMMKYKLRMHPLCMTFLPQMPTEIGRRNLENFKKYSFDHIAISPEPENYRQMAIDGFCDQGRPKLPFVTGISTAIMQMAIKMNIPFVIYGEEGESEYGGAMTQAFEPKIDYNYLTKYYYSGYDPSQYGWWWTMPKEIDFDKLYVTHFSHFENWEPRKHARLAKKKLGLQTEQQAGTFTNDAQLDDKLQDLHAYLMFVKFGFGRATSDVNIAIRAGDMTREEGLAIVRRSDGCFPWIYMDEYCEYFKMDEKEFFGIIESYVNIELLKKTDNSSWPWKLREEPK